MATYIGIEIGGTKLQIVSGRRPASAGKESEILLIFVVPVGIEPTSSESESEILSIEIRNHYGAGLDPEFLALHFKHPASSI